MEEEELIKRKRKGCEGQGLKDSKQTILDDAACSPEAFRGPADVTTGAIIG